MVDASIGGHEHAPSKGHEIRWGRLGLGLTVAGALFGTFVIGRTSAENTSGRQTETATPLTPVRQTEAVQAPAVDYRQSRMARADAELAEYDRLASKYHTSSPIIMQIEMQCRAAGDQRPLEECLAERMQAR